MQRSAPRSNRPAALGVALALTACSPGGASSNAARWTPAETILASHAGDARYDLRVRRAAAPNVAGYGPADLQAAYALPSTTQGAGQIVAVVHAYDNPNVAGDVSAYRANFGLPAATFTKFNQRGVQGQYPTGDVGWGVEIDSDVELVSASCPLCTVYLVEADSNAFSDLERAESEAVKLGATIVSNSFGGGSGVEQKYFDHKGVTYLGSAGTGLTLPADFPSVVAVGGTTLARAHNSRGWTESAWGDSGGCTTFPKPKWQHDAGCAYRMANDVSAVADPNPGVAVYDSYGVSGWMALGGTSVPTPLLAGIFGLAGNAAKQNGGRTFWQPAHHRDLYRVKHAGMGRYAPSTGWGSPKGTGAF